MRIKSYISLSLLQTSLLILALISSWTLLALFNFGYSIWFDALNISTFIEHTGPLNKYREGFEQLSKAEYVALFQQINQSIHLAPEALETITYSHTAVTGEIIESTLLRHAEILHLQDVAKLLRIGPYCLITVIILLICLCVYGPRKPLEQFMILRSVAILWSVIAGLTCIIFITNPVKVFYWLHDVIFPAGNQWFFYYQESLMTTLMKAPDLFGPITLAILILCVLFHLLYAFIFKKYISLFTTRFQTPD